MKKGIVIASFGTTHEDALKRTIDVIENKMGEKYARELLLPTKLGKNSK